MASRNMPSHNGPPAGKSSTTAPNQTLYLSNLPDKIRKPDLRLALYTLFATYGPVLDVNSVRGTEQMRGQAHVAFRDVQTATQAMRALQGFDFFGKPMRVQYARGKSDVIAKLDGTYRMGGAGAAAAGAGGGAGGSGPTELQQQIFGGVPPPPQHSLPQKVVAAEPSGVSQDGMEVDDAKTAAAEEHKGVKRAREEEDEEEESDEEAPMEEDSDAPMEEGSDDDD